MKIVIAPNAFKDCMSSYEAAIAIENGIKEFIPECDTVKVPVADGGDGILEALYIPLGGTKRKVTIKGPNFKEIESEYCFFEKQNFALIEMAKASGLALLQDDERNAAETTSYGTGELLRHAVEMGAKHILLGIGGSATNDAAIGLLSALGYRFLDKASNELSPIGKNLSKIAFIDDSSRNDKLDDVVIDVICDVDNPFYGPKGAAFVYAPQKGADEKMVKELDKGLRNFSDIVSKTYNIDISKIPGSGAAGGIGGAVYGILKGELKPGIEVVLDIVELEDKLSGADLVITAEGQIDHQTAFGKAPAGVARVAQKHDIPCIAIAGSIGENIGNLHEVGITSVFSLCNGPMELSKAIEKGDDLLQKATEQIVRCFTAGK